MFDWSAFDCLKANIKFVFESLTGASFRETVKPVRCADLGWQPEDQRRHHYMIGVLASQSR